jgi:hypothetical protein
LVVTIVAAGKPKSGLDNVLEGLSRIRGQGQHDSETVPSRDDAITPLRDDTVNRSQEIEEKARSLRELRDVRLVQTGVKVPLDLHELAENVAHDLRRQIDGRGVGAVYIALLERLRTDAQLRAWVEAYLRGEN